MISLFFILLGSIFISGVINRTTANFSGRKGQGILQPMKDILKLLKKGSVYSKVSGFVFKIAPSIYLSSVLTAVLFIPFGNSGAILSFDGDFIMFAYILAVGKFFMIAAALDTGSSFEGMGASREALFSMLAEPAFFILLGSLGVLTGFTSFEKIFYAIHNVYSASSYISYTIGIMAAFIFFALGLIENSRMPIDDPKTHLELTMVHEVMILDNSGYDLGLILYTGCLKFSMYGALAANLFLNPYFPLYLNIIIFAGIQFLYGCFIGSIESFSARFRMNQNPQVIFALSSVTLLVYIAVMLLTGKFNY